MAAAFVRAAPAVLFVLQMRHADGIRVSIERAWHADVETTRQLGCDEYPCTNAKPQCSPEWATGEIMAVTVTQEGDFVPSLNGTSINGTISFLAKYIHLLTSAWSFVWSVGKRLPVVKALFGTPEMGDRLAVIDDDEARGQRSFWHRAHNVLRGKAKNNRSVLSLPYFAEQRVQAKRYENLIAHADLTTSLVGSWTLGTDAIGLFNRAFVSPDGQCESPDTWGKIWIQFTHMVRFVDDSGSVYDGVLSEDGRQIGWDDGDVWYRAAEPMVTLRFFDLLESVKIREADRVKVLKEFLSDSNEPISLIQGDIGNVAYINSNGDALIDFEETPKHEWVSAENMQHLMKIGEESSDYSDVALVLKLLPEARLAKIAYIESTTCSAGGSQLLEWVMAKLQAWGFTEVVLEDDSRVKCSSDAEAVEGPLRIFRMLQASTPAQGLSLYESRGFKKVEPNTGGLPTYAEAKSVLGIAMEDFSDLLKCINTSPDMVDLARKAIAEDPMSQQAGITVFEWLQGNNNAGRKGDRLACQRAASVANMFQHGYLDQRDLEWRGLGPCLVEDYHHAQAIMKTYGNMLSVFGTHWPNQVFAATIGPATPKPKMPAARSTATAGGTERTPLPEQLVRRPRREAVGKGVNMTSGSATQRTRTLSPDPRGSDQRRAVLGQCRHVCIVGMGTCRCSTSEDVSDAA